MKELTSKSRHRPDLTDKPELRRQFMSILGKLSRAAQSPQQRREQSRLGGLALQAKNRVAKQRNRKLIDSAKG